jgi:signal transduction histidine kinase
VSWHRPEWTRTVRFRLTVTYSVLLFGLAALVVGGIYFGLSRSLDALFVGSLGIGWCLSGRALRPVARITAAAEEITATDLSRRIRLGGPDDELRRLADTLDGMLARLDDAFDAQRRFVDDASHELRNPLAIIQTTVDAVLSRDDVEPAERRHAVAVVGRASSRMSRLVEDLLASTRRSVPASTETDVDLAEVVAEASEEFRLLAGDRHLTPRRRVEPGTVVSGDRDALRRALANLVGNAVELAPEYTDVLVGAGREDGWCRMAVRDAGPGIPYGEQGRVFDRFWQGDGAGGRRAGHAGLGLAIVRQIAESHGGSVALHSAPASSARSSSGCGRGSAPATRPTGTPCGRRRPTRCPGCCRPEPRGAFSRRFSPWSGTVVAWRGGAVGAGVSGAGAGSAPAA